MTNPLPFGEIPQILLENACTLEGVTATTPTGEQVPIDQCDWIVTSPCGCPSGLTVTVSRGEVKLTEESVWKALFDTKRERDAQIKAGGRVFLVTHESFCGEVGKTFTGKCGHDPKWGQVRKTKTVDGIEFTQIDSRALRVVTGDITWTIEKRTHGWSICRTGWNRSEYLARLQADALKAAARMITDTVGKVAV